MTKLLNSIHEAENKFDIVAEQFLFHHPLLGGLIIFIGIPIFILIAVTICITIVTFPFAFIFGWL